MKKLFAILICVAQFLSMTGNAATCTNYISDGFGNPIPTRVIITPFTPSIVFGGTNVLGPSVAFNAPQGAWAARLLGGFYLVQQGLGQPNITIFAAPNDPQTNSLAFFAIAATNPIPSFFSSGQGLAITVSNFNANQFIFAWNTISIITGALVTNLFDYGDFNVAGTNNTDGTFTIYDPGTNAIAGFDTNKGGFYGQANSTNLYYPISTFVGPTNSITLNNTYWNYTTTSDIGITNTFGITNGLATWATLNVSNQTANVITGYVTIPFARAIGSQTIPNMPIPSGKVGMWSLLSVGGLVTNYVAAVQDAATAPITITTLYIVTNFTTNLFVSQAFITNLYVSQAFITNLYVSTNFSTNFYSSTAYITNLYVSTNFSTNLYVSQAFITNLYVSTNFTTNLFFQSGKGNTLIITNNLNLDYIPASSILALDAVKNVTNAGLSARFTFTGNVLDIAAASIPNADLVNSSITIQGSAVALGGSTLAAGSSPFFNGNNITNVTPQYSTNAIPSSGVCTMGNAYETNLQASVTLPAFTIGTAYYESLVIDCTNSTGADTAITMPAGVIGTPGSGATPKFFVTNKLGATIYVQHYGNHRTNAWKIDWAP